MKNKKLIGRLIIAILVIIAGVCFFVLKNKASSSDTSKETLISVGESQALLKEIDAKGLQKFIDDHNISKDDVLNTKVGPLIATGQKEWVIVGSQIYYGNVVTHDAGFNETLEWYLAHAIDKNPVVVLQTIDSFPQTRSFRSRRDSSLVLSTATTTSADVIKSICNKSDYDYDDSRPDKEVYSDIINQLKGRSSHVEKVGEPSVKVLKTACLSGIDAQIKSMSEKVDK